MRQQNPALGYDIMFPRNLETLTWRPPSLHSSDQPPSERDALRIVVAYCLPTWPGLPSYLVSRARRPSRPTDLWSPIYLTLFATAQRTTVRQDSCWAQFHISAHKSCCSLTLTFLFFFPLDAMSLWWLIISFLLSPELTCDTAPVGSEADSA